MASPFQSVRGIIRENAFQHGFFSIIIKDSFRLLSSVERETARFISPTKIARLDARDP